MPLEYIDQAYFNRINQIREKGNAFSLDKVHVEMHNFPKKKLKDVIKNLIVPLSYLAADSPSSQIRND